MLLINVFCFVGLVYAVVGLTKALQQASTELANHKLLAEDAQKRAYEAKQKQ